MTFWILTLLSAQLSWADSEFLHQTPTARAEATVILGHNKLTQDLDSAQLSKVETTTTRMRVFGEYGWDEMWSTGLNLKYLSGSVDYVGGNDSNDFKGLTDPSLFVKHRRELGMGLLRVGLHLGIPLGKKEIDASGDYNVTSGGFSLTPVVGYEQDWGVHTFGTQLSYSFWLGDRKITDKSFGLNNTTVEVEETLKGGEVLAFSLFYEWQMEPVTLGAAWTLESVAAQTKTFDPATSGNTSPDRTAPTTEMKLQVYVPWRATSDLTVLPQLTYGRYTAFNTEATDSIQEIDASLGARLAF